jgi:hypothetical protein
MPRIIVRQPDGMFAIFSTVVDSWVLYDATEDDIVNEYCQNSIEDATRNARQFILNAKNRTSEAFEKYDEVASRHGGRLESLPHG